MKRLGYVPALDGLRGIAILLVVGYHYLAWPRFGWVGVDVFFVLSGYLITTLLLSEHAATGTVSLRRFYSRRARRLLPALGLLLTVQTALAAGATGAFMPVVYSALYISNIAQAAGVDMHGLTPLWSLAQEEQFYFVWPLLLFAALRRNVSRRTLFMLLAAAALLVELRRVELYLTGADYNRLYYAPDARFDAIIVGCALAFALAHSGVRERVARLWPAAFVTLAFVAFTGVDFVPRGKFFFGIPAAAAATSVIIAAALGDGALARALAWRPLVGLGVVSYGVYLWHLYLLSMFPAVPAIILTAAATWLSYRYVEQPFRRRRVQPTPAVAVAASTPS